MSWTQVSNDVKVCKKCGYVGGEFEMYCEGCGWEMNLSESGYDFENECYIDEFEFNNIDLVLESKRSKMLNFKMNMKGMIK